MKLDRVYLNRGLFTEGIKRRGGPFSSLKLPLRFKIYDKTCRKVIGVTYLNPRTTITVRNFL